MLQGYTDVDIKRCRKLICQLDIQLVCREAKTRKVAFSTVLRGTVPSGFSARTTLGNTLYNMAYQLYITRGLKARSFASGDDGAFLLDPKDVTLVKQRIENVTVSNNLPQTKGCGLLIDSALTFDTKLLCFLSKVIEIGSSSVVRLYERVYTSGTITSSNVPMAQINHSVNTQLKEYAKMPFYRESILPRARLEADEKEIKNAKFRNEMSYKEDFSKNLNLPMEYLSRIGKQTGGLTFSFQAINDAIVSRDLANIELSDFKLADQCTLSN